MKICTKCNIEKDVSEFYKSVKEKSGLTTHCKECMKLQAKKQQKRIRVYNKPILDKDKIKIRERAKQWKKNNLDQFYYNTVKNRAKYKNKSFTLTIEQFSEIVKQPCHYCGSVAPIDKRNGIDRKDNDIGYENGNCLPCCYSCNVSKNTRSYTEFINWIKTVCNHLVNTIS